MPLFPIAHHPTFRAELAATNGIHDDGSRAEAIKAILGRMSGCHNYMLRAVVAVLVRVANAGDSNSMTGAFNTGARRGLGRARILWSGE